MVNAASAPQILELSWGSVQVDGAPRPYRDAKLYPGGSREWDWNETGTHHSPGIQPADVEELLERGAEAVVLSRGQQERLEVQPETLTLLEEAGVETHVLETREAVELYNCLAAERAVGALIHSTC